MNMHIQSDQHDNVSKMILERFLQDSVEHIWDFAATRAKTKTKGEDPHPPTSLPPPPPPKKKNKGK